MDRYLNFKKFDENCGAAANIYNPGGQRLNSYTGPLGTGMVSAGFDLAATLKDAKLVDELQKKEPDFYEELI